jgi:adenylate cyclase
LQILRRSPTRRSPVKDVDYTAYGDTINVGARLETANKQLRTRTGVSATLAEAVKNFYGRPIGDLLLRGRAEAVRDFEPARK